VITEEIPARVKADQAYQNAMKNSSKSAERIFQQMLWLNPSDNQGVRSLIDEVKGGTAWQGRENE
jgi:hypothetical protein